MESSSDPMIDDGTTILYLDPNVQDLEWVEDLWLWSGGAFTGAYHVHSLFMAKDRLHSTSLVGGTSVGSLGALAAASDHPALYEALFAEIDDRHAWNGVDGIMAPRATGIYAWLSALISAIRGKDWRSNLPSGLVSLEPLRNTIKKNLSLDDVVRPYLVGVVSKTTGRHYVCVMGPGTPWELQLDIILASCAMGAICEPIEVQIPGRPMPEILVDGGHHSLVPMPHRGALKRLRQVRAFFTAPPVHAPPSDDQGLLGSLKWSIGQAMRAAMRGDLAELAAWDNGVVRVQTGFPDVRSHGFLDASKEAYEARIRESVEIWKRMENGLE